MELDATTRLLVAAGVAEPFVYAVTMIVGAAVRPGYSHYGNAVSELVGTGAPDRAALNVGFMVYNLLVVAFAAGLLKAFGVVSTAITIAGWALAITGAIGPLMWWFAMDPIGARPTFAGVGHIVIAGFMSVGMMAAVLGFAIGAAELESWASFATYSHVTFGLLLLSGALAALSAARHWPSMGLLERLTIGCSLQWMAMLAFVLLARS